MFQFFGNKLPFLGWAEFGNIVNVCLGRSPLIVIKLTFLMIFNLNKLFINKI